MRRTFRVFLQTLLALPLCAQSPSGPPISAQLFTVRNSGTLDQQFAIIEQAGIHYVEMYRFFGMPETPADELKALLSKHHLQISGFHIAISELADNLAHTIEYNKAIGNTRLIVPALTTGFVPQNKADWQAMGRVFEILALSAKAQGMKIGFHNHTVEMQVYEDKTGFEWFAEAAPDVILTVDCAWAGQGGQDPAALITRLKGHVWNIHVKDNAPTGTAQDQRGLATVGQGTLNWERILTAAKDAGVQWYTLEHDVPKPDPLTVLKDGLRFIQPLMTKLGIN